MQARSYWRIAGVRRPPLIHHQKDTGNEQSTQRTVWHSIGVGCSSARRLQPSGERTFAVSGYVPPQGGETARIRLLTDGLIRTVPERDCLNWNVPGAGGEVMASAKTSAFPDRSFRGPMRSRRAGGAGEQADRAPLPGPPAIFPAVCQDHDLCA